MRLSRYFLPVLKENPAEAQIVSHRLMLRAGMIKQAAAGIYSWLPLGFRVLRKIENIVHEEQIRAGHIPMLMPTLQSADLWRESGRYDDYGEEMLRIKDRHDRDMLYTPTAEELITDIFRAHVSSYRDLPLTMYQIQWKFRDEVRPRFGVMRVREFLMKDAYSFDLTEDGARAAYRKMFCAYLNAFDRMGLTAVPMRADTGPIGGDLSHEFIIMADTGESAVFCDKALLDMPAPGLDLDFDADLTAEVEKRTQYYAATEEMHDEAAFNALPEERRVSARGIEVGHIFYFGTKYSAPMKAEVQDQDGKMVPVQMGSYGIGVSRLVGGIIEACHDESGIVWPEAVAPFHVGLINMRAGDAACDKACLETYEALEAAGIEALYDDTDDRAGAKFARMDVIGLPWQLVIGPKGLEKGVVEVKHRKTGEKVELPLAEAIAKVTPA